MLCLANESKNILNLSSITKKIGCKIIINYWPIKRLMEEKIK